MSSSLVRRAVSAEVKTVQYPYYVSRQPISGRLPVYNEFRAGTKATTLIRNVDGNAGVRLVSKSWLAGSRSNALMDKLNQNTQALRNDLLASLFRPAKRPPKIHIRHGKHVEIQGTWREPVAQWLLSRGF
jgi:hypothetical protein